jgi:hypothetical protein
VKPVPKKTLADKLILWRQAYYAVLDELRVDDRGDRPEYRTAAARTAAILIQGVSDGSDAPS